MCKCVSNKQREELCRELKGIYKASNYEEAKENSKAFKEKWSGNILLMKKFNEYEQSMLELYTYSENIRKLIYTTNAIESVNSCLRKVTNGKGCFINKTALEKVLYLRIRDLEDKWKRVTRSNWAVILNELIILFGERVEKHIEI
jgi:transposase-like protein